MEDRLGAGCPGGVLIPPHDGTSGDTYVTTEILLDCDPGHDDAIALVLALADSRATVGGVTTVAGNQTLGKTTENALKTLALADREDVPVAAGMDRPMTRELRTAPEVHGESGLDGPDLPEPTADPIDDHAVEFIADTARERDGLTLVPTGPLTNVGMALRKYPELETHLDRIVLMGGSIDGGNVTPAAEFNVLVDPEAASIVFAADVPVTMVGLEVTRAARLTPETFDRFRELGSEPAVVTAELLEFFVRFHREQFGWDGVPVHDACAVADVLEPGIVAAEPMHVAVETRGDHTAGRTVCDRLGVTGEAPNAEVGVDIDDDRFRELLTEALASY